MGAGRRNSDEDVDQYRIPEGSLFLELYCPRSFRETNMSGGTHAKAPRGLYAVNANGDSTLLIGKMAPRGALGQHPVWRAAISEAHHTGASRPTYNTLGNWSGKPDTISFQPEDMSLLGWLNRDPAPLPAYGAAAQKSCSGTDHLVC